jgi:tetratricopeptide (TPR) repeat protein
MEDYLALNRIDEAKAVYRHALERKVDNAFLHDDEYVLAFLQDDTQEMERQAAWAMGKPGAEDLLVSAEADTEAYFGHSRMAMRLSQRAVKFAANNHQQETAALWQLDNALQEAEFGNFNRARQGAQEGLARASTRDVQILAALTLARAGDSLDSQALYEVLQKRFPSNMELNNYWLPCVRAAIQINLGNPALAVEILEVSKPYELAFPRPQATGGGPLYPVWLRGLAFLLLHRGKEAAAEFQKILNHRTVVANSPVSALAHLQLARAFAMQGDTSKERSAYEAFLILWKDADTDLPILVQAKTEYANMKLAMLH